MPPAIIELCKSCTVPIADQYLTKHCDEALTREFATSVEYRGQNILNTQTLVVSILILYGNAQTLINFRHSASYCCSVGCHPESYATKKATGGYIVALLMRNCGDKIKTTQLQFPKSKLHVVGKLRKGSTWRKQTSPSKNNRKGLRNGYGLRLL